MMMRLLLAVVMVLLFVAVPASAHRLDEYLQAATIEVTPGRIMVQLRLTPGVSVAPALVSSIYGDGAASYAERVRQDLSLTLDGRVTPLRLVSFHFPAVDELTAGAGDIDLRFEAELLAAGPHHSLEFENRHARAIALYLVNTLLPRSPEIRITSQDRSYDQSVYHLDFSVGAVPVGSRAPQRGGDSLAIVGSYFWHGVHHILTGYDHLLFVAALALGAATLWDLVKVVTAFTLAHSLTLTLAALNLVHVQDAVVEPLISASIVCVALQNIAWPERSRGGVRLATAFFFGLFHGLGFAGGLLDIMHQMPRETVLLAILGFSLGVEAGNQMVLLPPFGALKLIWSAPSVRFRRSHVPRMVQRIGSASISAAGSYYLFVALAG